MVEDFEERAGSLEPSLAAVEEELRRHLVRDRAIRASTVADIVRERAWQGRIVDILSILTEDPERMSYLAGGYKLDELMSSLALWAQCPLSVSEIRWVVSCAGWDPEPFVPLARAGLLARFLYLPDGSPRRIKGERAGGWLSDQFALADEQAILKEVTSLLDSEDAGVG